MSDLGTLGGGSSVATSINDNGKVVGIYSVGVNLVNPLTRAFLYTNGSMSDLGTLGGITSIAKSINNSGQVVGYSTDQSRSSRAFLYSNGVMSDLNSLLYPNSGWKLSDAVDINDLGQIVGTGVFDGQTRAFLMTPTDISPVPLPASAWLFASSLFGLLCVARKTA
jgi:probable HAF family extracellular repeat protein